MSELVKCGCGGEPVIKRFSAFFKKLVRWYVFCPMCRTQTEVCLFKEEAISRWNRAMRKDLYGELGNDEFMIVDNNRVERYKKDKYLPTPVQKNKYLTKLDAEIDSHVRVWYDTQKRPPTDKDCKPAAELARKFLAGEVECIDIYGEFHTEPWEVVAKKWWHYPRWTPIER